MTYVALKMSWERPKVTSEDLKKPTRTLGTLKGLTGLGSLKVPIVNLVGQFWDARGLSGNNKALLEP